VSYFLKNIGFNKMNYKDESFDTLVKECERKDRELNLLLLKSVKDAAHACDLFIQCIDEEISNDELWRRCVIETNKIHGNG